MFQNPDNIFVLRGRKTRVREKDTTFLSNSQRTLSTQNLSQTTAYRPDTRSSMHSSGAWTGRQSFAATRQSYRSPSPDNPYAEIQEDLRSKNSELSLDLRSLNSSLNKSLNKSVSFSDTHMKPRDEDEHSLDDTFEEELRRLIANDTLDIDDRDQTLAGKPNSYSTSQWYTEPLHLTRNTDFPVFDSLGAREHTVSSVNRTAGMLGTELAQKKVSSSILLDEKSKMYFPVTLAEAPEVMQTLTPPPPLDASTRNVMDRTARSVVSDAGPRGAGSRPLSASRKPMSASSRMQTRDVLRSSVKTSAKHRNGFHENGMSQTLTHGVATGDPQVKATRDYNYLKASQPFVDQMVVASPFEYELAKLRMERLRLEEQRILETKRQEELERIRGPTPKWYEMKTPQFTYEHTKNNQLNKSKKDWQGLFDYRTRLLSASQDLAKSTN